MLKEFMNNELIELSLSIDEFQKLLMVEFSTLIHENCKVDVQNSSTMTSAEMDAVIIETKNICARLLNSTIINPQQKNFVVNSVMTIFLDLWRTSDNAELFFIKLRQNFTPAFLVSMLSMYISEWERYRWVMNFFATHKQIFPRPNRRIRTIGVYYTRIFNGGIEMFLSRIIPIYIQLGYRVVLFTDISHPEIEYPLPPL